MKLAHLSWPEADALSRQTVVVIPTGSMEQHGAHLPLFTDSILATAVAEAVEEQMPDKVLLVPTLWLGASGHHMAFAGTLTATFETYARTIQDVVESLIVHGFERFFILNGHGGNTDSNGIATRELKARHPELWFGHLGYYAFAEAAAADILEGPAKRIQHACEAETSLMLHLRPELVRTDKLRDDGLSADPPVLGMVSHFDELTEQGSLGYATLATAGKGRKIFDAAVAGACANLDAVYNGYVFTSSH